MQCTCVVLSSEVCLVLQYFVTLSHKQHDLKKKLLNVNVLFFVKFLTETFLILERFYRTERAVFKNAYWSSCEVNVILVRFLMKFEFFGHIFEKYPSIIFYENPTSGSRVFPCGRTDIHDKANNSFTQFRELAWKEYYYTKFYRKLYSYSAYFLLHGSILYHIFQ